MAPGFTATSAAQLTVSIIITSRLTFRQNGERLKHTLSQLSSEVVILTAKQRELVEQAIRETCEVRKWILLAINVRTNHVHLVVSMGSPNRVGR